MPRETTYPTTRPTWLAETVAQAWPPGQRSKSAKGPQPKRPHSTPAKGPSPSSPVSMPAVALGSLASRANNQPNSANIVAIMSAVCTYHAIPLALGLTVFDHENLRSFTDGFAHPDGLMQTNSVDRTEMIPRIPRPLARQLLELPANDKTNDATLTRLLHEEFPHRMAVQIAVGVQKIVIGLRAFNGYVALALIAYNAGLDNAYRIATSGLGKAKQGPRFPAGTTEADWEKACHFGASLLHQPASAVKIKKGSWFCDAQNSTWKPEIMVWDPTGKVQLIAYQYLRRIKVCMLPSPPSVACNAKTKISRDPGTGKETCADTRPGALDKLYDPTRLRRPQLRIEAGGGMLQSIPQDARPLKIEAGRFVWV